MVGKTVRAWLAMREGGQPYWQPTSEEDYMAHLDLIDVAMPGPACHIQADGSWKPVDDIINSDFARALPEIARQANQRYVPIAVMEATESSMVFLDNERLWEDAANALVDLALADSFDAPWDGVGYDFDTFLQNLDYNQKHGAFIRVLSNKVRRAGLSFEVGYHAVIGRSEEYQVSLDVVADVADAVDYYIFFWHEQPWPLSPWWWAVESIEHALARDIPPRRFYLGVANFCLYVPVSTEYYAPSCIYNQAIDIVQEHNARIEWIERHETRLMREKYADLGIGHIWIHDGDTVMLRLELVNRYGLAGIMLFQPGMGHESVWDAIAEWKRPTPIDERPRGAQGKMTAQKLMGLGGTFSIGN